LHRWRSGGEPLPVFAARLEALEEFLDELEETFRRRETLASGSRPRFRRSRAVGRSTLGQGVRRFHLFVACDLSPTQLQDALREQRGRFAAIGIDYEAWSAARLRNQLRGHLEIVHTLLCARRGFGPNDAEFDEELRYHFDREFERSLARGMTGARMIVAGMTRRGRCRARRG
jgi:hypothetical protein